jgi:hypothetical protein
MSMRSKGLRCSASRAAARIAWATLIGQGVMRNWGSWVSHRRTTWVSRRILTGSSSCSGRGSTNASVTRPETRPGSRSPFQTKWTESIACASTHSPAFDTLALVGEVLVVPEADQPGGWAPVSGDGHGAPAGLLTAQSRRPPTPGAVPLLQGVVADEAAAETSLEEGDGCHVGADEVEALSLSSFQDLPIQ